MIRFFSTSLILEATWPWNKTSAGLCSSSLGLLSRSTSFIFCVGFSAEFRRFHVGGRVGAGSNYPTTWRRPSRKDSLNRSEVVMSGASESGHLSQPDAWLEFGAAGWVDSGMTCWYLGSMAIISPRKCVSLGYGFGDLEPRRLGKFQNGGKKK